MFRQHRAPVCTEIIGEELDHDWLSRPEIALGSSARVDYEHFYFMLEAASAGPGVGIAPWRYITDDICFGELTAPTGFLDSGNEYVALRRDTGNSKSSIFCHRLAEQARDFQSANMPPSCDLNRRLGDLNRVNINSEISGTKVEDGPALSEPADNPVCFRTNSSPFSVCSDPMGREKLFLDNRLPRFGRLTRNGKTDQILLKLNSRTSSYVERYGDK